VSPRHAGWIRGLAVVAALAIPLAAAARPESELWPLLEGYRWDELRSRGPGVVDKAPSPSATSRVVGSPRSVRA